jgi:plastocyanin
MLKRIRYVGAAIVLIATVAACGSSSSGGSTPASTSGSGSGNTVTIQGFAFHPASITVKVGTKVTFTNEDGTIHTATSNPSGLIDSGNLNKGQSYTVTFTKAGTYHYICSIHQNMTGTVIVQ